MNDLSRLLRAELDRCAVTKTFSGLAARAILAEERSGSFGQLPAGSMFNQLMLVFEKTVGAATEF